MGKIKNLAIILQELMNLDGIIDEREAMSLEQFNEFWGIKGEAEQSIEVLVIQTLWGTFCMPSAKEPFTTKEILLYGIPEADFPKENRVYKQSQEDVDLLASMHILP